MSDYISQTITVSSCQSDISNQCRGHMGGGGGDWGYLELGPGTPAMGQGVHIQEKSSQDQGPNTPTAATIRKEVLTPPSKKGYPGAGGYRGQIQKKNRWGIIFGPK